MADDFQGGGATFGRQADAVVAGVGHQAVGPGGELLEHAGHRGAGHAEFVGQRGRAGRCSGRPLVDFVDGLEIVFNGRG